MRRGVRWGIASLGFVAVLVSGCNSAATSPGTATFTGGGGETSASKTIDTGGRSTISRTIATTSTSSSKSTSSKSSTSSSSTTTSTTDTGPTWNVQVSSYSVPDKLLAISPAGVTYLTFAADNVCVHTWDGAQVGCPVNVPGATRVFAVYSADGNHLGVIATYGDGLSTVYLVPLSTGTPAILTTNDMQPAAGADPATVRHLAITSAVWDDKETTFYVQLAADAGAATGDLLLLSPVGQALVTIPVPAEVANSNPSMWATTKKVLFAPNTGPQTGTLWQLTSDLQTKQVGSKKYNPDGTLSLISMDYDGAYAMFCPVTGTTYGALHEVNLDTGEDYTYLKEDEGCLGAAYSTDSAYVAVVGPIGESLVLTVLSTTSDEAPANEVLNGSVQPVPALVTWTKGDVITVIEGDLTDKLAKISILTLYR